MYAGASPALKSGRRPEEGAALKIAKPMLLVLTPIGVGWGLIEAWRFHWWLAVLMGALVSVISLFMWMTVKRIRDERRQT